MGLYEEQTSDGVPYINDKLDYETLDEIIRDIRYSNAV